MQKPVLAQEFSVDRKPFGVIHKGLYNTPDPVIPADD